MKSVYRFLCTTVVALVSIGATSGSAGVSEEVNVAAAFACVGCKDYEITVPGGPPTHWHHAFNTTQGVELMNCNSGDGCHFNHAEEECVAVHDNDGCDTEPGGGDSPESGSLLVAFESAVAAARDGRTAELSAILASNPRIEINRERGALQLIDCRGDHATGHYELPTNSTLRSTP